MLRRISVSATSAAIGLLFGAVAASAASDPAPNPPPGFVSVQPVSASAGGPTQANGPANASTGSSSAYSNGGGTGAGHCGVQASGAGTGYQAGPNQVNTSGSPKPNGCASTSGTTATSTSATDNARNSSSLTTSSKSAATRGTGEAVPAGVPTSSLMKGAATSGVAALLGAIGLLGLAILLAFFFFLLGALLGRRRQARTTA